mgnify:CR=1 FL=1
MDSDAETTGWAAALSKSISSPFSSFFNSLMDTDMVSQLEENQQKQDKIYSPAPAPTPITHVDNGKAADSWLYFCIKIRLEGKHGKILWHIICYFCLYLSCCFYAHICNTNYIYNTQLNMNRCQECAHPLQPGIEHI